MAQVWLCGKRKQKVKNEKFDFPCGKLKVVYVIVHDC